MPSARILRVGRPSTFLADSARTRSIAAAGSGGGPESRSARPPVAPHAASPRAADRWPPRPPAESPAPAAPAGRRTRSAHGGASAPLQTIPCSRAADALSASRSTSSSTRSESTRPHAAASEVSSNEVSTVTASTPHRAPAASSAAPRAASSMARPPDACTVSRRTPRAAARRTAPGTVVGMSWNLRSRKTSRPESSRSARTIVGPAAV